MALFFGLSGLASTGAGCFLVSSPGSGEAEPEPIKPRRIAPEDVALQPGYRIEAVAKNLTFPNGVTFDDQGTPYVVESGYVHGEVFTTARLLRIEGDGRVTTIREGRNGPWTGAVYHQGSFIIAEGGVTEGGRIVKIAADGTRTVLAENLPSYGDHQTNGPVVGPDGYVYFGQGTATNSGIVGPDNEELGWLKRYPQFHDVPCKDVKLTGKNFTSDNPFKADHDAVTGAFQPFGTPTQPGQLVRGAVPCSGAIMRVGLSGGPIELVAWGFRNPFGLAFSADGALFATDSGYDARGSRPILGNADSLWRVEQGTWYGWPDYADGRPLTDAPGSVLAQIPNEPPRPIAFFGVRSSSNGIAFSRNPKFGFVGEAFVAQFGDRASTIDHGMNPVGFKVVRVDVTKGVVTDFATNKDARNGPASKLDSGGLERPVSVQFDPSGERLYVVDFGTLHDDADVTPMKSSGVLWRIVPDANAR